MSDSKNSSINFTYEDTKNITPDTVKTESIEVNKVYMPARTPPASASASGTAGEMLVGVDSGTYYLYFCVSTDTWQRVAFATWGGYGK